MKLIIIAAASAAILGGSSAYGQNSQPRVKEPEARTPGQPTVGPPQTTDPRTTTRQGPIKAPGSVGSSPYGAKGGATGAPNPDRVPAGTPGGASRPPGEGP
jgi:hypothetical protein